MGEIAEMMLDGFMCEQCGEVMGDIDTGESQGFPGLCAGCRRTSGLRVPTPLHKRKNKPQASSNRKHRCQTCSKGFKSASALEQHQRDSHGTSAIRFTRTGRTITFDEVDIGCIFFAGGQYFMKIEPALGMSLRSTAGHGNNFLDTRTGKSESKIVEVVTVEGNDRK